MKLKNRVDEARRKGKAKLGWWKVEGRARNTKDGTLIVELQHPQSEYDKHRGEADRDE